MMLEFATCVDFDNVDVVDSTLDSCSAHQQRSSSASSSSESLGHPDSSGRDLEKGPANSDDGFSQCADQLASNALEEGFTGRRSLSDSIDTPGFRSSSGLSQYEVVTTTVPTYAKGQGNSMPPPTSPSQPLSASSVSCETDAQKSAKSRLAPTATPFIFPPKQHLKWTGSDDLDYDLVSNTAALDLSSDGLGQNSRAIQIVPSHSDVTAANPAFRSSQLTTRPPNLETHDAAPEGTAELGESGWATLSREGQRSSAFHDDESEAWGFNNDGDLINRDARYHIATEILQLQARDRADLQGNPVNADGSGETVPAHIYTEYPDRRTQSSSFRDARCPGESSGSYSVWPTTVPSSLSDTANGYGLILPRGRSVSLGSAVVDRRVDASSYLGPKDDLPRSLRDSLETRLPQGRGSISDEAGQNLDDTSYIEARNMYVREALANHTGGQLSLAAQAAIIARFDLAMLHQQASIPSNEWRANLAVPNDEQLSPYGFHDAIGFDYRFPYFLEQESIDGGSGLPSANNRKHSLYKTELCRSWEEKGSCRYGSKCQFAHGIEDLRVVPRHPKFKSEVCRTFGIHGSCPYGRRCCFIHTTHPPDAIDLLSGSSSSSSSSSSSTSGTGALRSRSSQSSFRGDSAVSRCPAANRSPSVATGLSTGDKSMATSFGPALANYLGTSERLAGEKGTPLKVRDQSQLTAGDMRKARAEPVIMVGLSIKAPNPAEVPPTFQAPPKSRLHRLASVPSLHRDVSRADHMPQLSQPTHYSQNFVSFATDATTFDKRTLVAVEPFHASSLSTAPIARASSDTSLASQKLDQASAYLAPVDRHWLGQSSNAEQPHLSVNTFGPLEWGSHDS